MIEVPDDLQPLHTVPEPDWELIEHLASLAHRTGDVYRNRVVTAERARQILEMDGETIDVIVGHMFHLRRDDLQEALICVDTDGSFIAATLEQRDPKPAAKERQEPEPRRAPPRPQVDRWAQCLAAPADALAALAEVEAGASSCCRRDRIRRLGTVVGLRGLTGRVEGMEAAVLERRRALEELVQQGPEPGSEAELIADALNWRDQLPELDDLIASWLRRYPGSGQSWQEWFRSGSCFQRGELAVEAIARVIGVEQAEVQAHADRIAERDQLQRRQVEAAWTDAEDLLRDARAAGGWGLLGSAIGVAPWQLERRCAELKGQS
jgi:hypothetical protein